MKRTILIASMLLLCAAHDSNAQLLNKLYVGFGGGLDYGGIGAQASYHPGQRLALFGGLGYNFNTAGYNLGAQLRFPNERKVSAYLTGMYGYNAVLSIKGNVTSKNSYYGPTFGGGIQLRPKKSDQSFFMFGILVPIRAQAYYDAIDDIKFAGYEVRDLPPIAITVGYHIRLMKQP